MQTTKNSATLNKIKADDTYYELKLTKVNSDASTETLNVQVADLKLTNLINADGFSIGETCSSCLEFTDINNVLLPILGSQVKVELGVEISKINNVAVYEYINMGHYIIQKPEIESDRIKYIGYDLMITLEQDSPVGGYNPSTGERDKNPCTIDEYMNQLVLFAQQRASANGTPSIRGWRVSGKTAFNSGKVIRIPENVSMRQMVGYIAMLMGCNAYIDREGDIVFKGYETTDEIIDDTRIYDEELTIQNSEPISVGAVTCTFKKENVPEEEAETTYTKGTIGVGVHLTISDNPLIKNESDVDFIYNTVSKYSLMTVSAKTLGNPLYDVGDIIYANNKNTPLAIMNIEFEYDGGLTNLMSAEIPTETESTYRTTSSTDIQAEEYARNFNDILKALANKVATDELSAKVAEIDNLTADSAIIKNIFSESVSTDYISAINALIGVLKATDITADTGTFNYLQADKLNAKYIQTTDITAESGKFNYLQSDKLDTKYINADEIEAESGKYHYLTTDSLNADYIQSTSAAIANLISRLSISDKTVTVDGKVTGELDAVEINANNINTGSLATDRLIIKGTNGSIVYALNNMGELVSENVDSIDGYVLTDRTISADKIIAQSITATEIDVASLIASQAFINQLLSSKVIVGGINDNIMIGGVNILTNSKLMTDYTIKQYLCDENSNRLTDGTSRLYI